MDIILDSNIFRNDLYFKSSLFKALQDYLEKTNSNFIMPKIILDEVKELFKENLKDSIKDFNTASSKINKALNRDEESISAINIENEIKYYEDYIFKKLRINTHSIVPYKNEYLPEVIERAIQKKRPFQSNDKGFRDTIIWLYLLDYCKDCYEKQIVFISNNPTDFGDKSKPPKLHPTLLEDATKCNVTVHYFNDTKAFIEGHSSKISDVDSNWLQKNIDNEKFENLVNEFLNSTMHQEVIENIKDICSINCTGHYSSLYSNILDIGEITIYEMKDDSLIINSRVETETEVEFEHLTTDDFRGLGGWKPNIDITYLSLDFDCAFTVQGNKIINVDIVSIN